MSQKVIQGSAKLAEAIRSRRQELGLTIETAASRAGIGIKTWCRYETGESIRVDKAKGVCKALNWHAMPSESEDDSGEFDFKYYKTHKAWSNYIAKHFGEAAAISFVIGSDILLDDINSDLSELSAFPKGTHIGQLPISTLKDILPQQFLMRYDYDFLYCLKTTAIKLQDGAHFSEDFAAHSVLQELVIYLFMEEAEFLMECMEEDMEKCGVSDLDIWKDWAFDLFDDMDIVTCLYSDDYLMNDHIYHFDHWMENQFYV